MLPVVSGAAQHFLVLSKGAESLRESTLREDEDSDQRGGTAATLEAPRLAELILWRRPVAIAAEVVVGVELRARNHFKKQNHFYHFFLAPPGAAYRSAKAQGGFFGDSGHNLTRVKADENSLWQIVAH